MKTQRIQAPDIQAALRQVRNLLGDDAVIMTSRETAGGIEIIAGTMQGPDTAPGTSSSAASSSILAPASARERPIRARGTGAAANRRSALSSMVAELARPSGTGAGDATAGRVETPAPKAARAVSSLRSELDALGLASDLRAQVIEDVRNADSGNDWDAAVCSLTTRIPIQGNSVLKHGGRVVMVGGTGVGKTTTIAKLAAHFARMHGPRSVALVNTDTFRVGASEQLRRYARLMGIAMCNVRGPSELGRAFEKLSDRKLVLVDTAGTNYHDVHLMQHLEELRGAGTDVSCYLAASFNTQTSVLEKTVRAFKRLALSGCVLTKSDEAVSLGPAISIVARHGLPVGFVTTGPGVPADIRVARGDWLVERAMELAEEARREDAAVQLETTNREVG